MICNAGRNYLVFKSDGQVFRCQCHLEFLLGDMSHIDQWITQVQLFCPLTETCENDHPGEWQRASRFDDKGNLIDKGVMAVQPENELVTRIFLTGNRERSSEEWCSLFDRLARRYKKCWHRIEGDDPANFQGIAQLIEKVSFLGDHLTYVTNFTSNTTRIVDVLAKASVDCVHFVAIIDPTSQEFNDIKMLGRLRLIHERGFKVHAIMPGTLGTFYLFETFFEKISNRYGIPMSFIPQIKFPEHMRDKLNAIVSMGAQSTTMKVNDHETFSCL